MSLKEPTSIEECIYFTQRSTGKGHVKCWVFKELCPECGKALMSKPRDEKTGKPKIRAKEYQCPECGYTVPKDEYEETLTANIKYTCPKCNFSGEIQIPFKREKVKIFNKQKNKEISVESLRFQCEKCKENIDVTKKMK